MLEPYGLDLETAEAKFTNLVSDVSLVLFTQESHCAHCNEARRLYEHIASVTRKIEFEFFNFAINEEKAQEYRIFAVPALAIIGVRDYGIRYYGYPRGTELSNFLDDIVYVSRGENTLSSATTRKLEQLDETTNLKIFISSGCPYSLPAAKLGLKLAVASDNINVDIVHAADFLQLADNYGVRGIPTTVVNERTSIYGALDAEDYVDRILEAS